MGNPQYPREKHTERLHHNLDPEHSDLQSTLSSISSWSWTEVGSKEEGIRSPKETEHKENLLNRQFGSRSIKTITGSAETEKLMLPEGENYTENVRHELFHILGNKS
jgi:hypothetical protein